jgi:hypothetical protein
MPGEDAFFVADSGQVNAEVPAKKERNVIPEAIGQGSI